MDTKLKLILFPTATTFQCFAYKSWFVLFWEVKWYFYDSVMYILYSETLNNVKSKSSLETKPFWNIIRHIGLRNHLSCFSLSWHVYILVRTSAVSYWIYFTTLSLLAFLGAHLLNLIDVNTACVFDITFTITRFNDKCKMI